MSIDFLSTKVPGQFKRERMIMSVNGGAVDSKQNRTNLDLKRSGTVAKDLEDHLI